MGQPNLSRAIKELEESVGITIFKRTSKGIAPTQKGERFLEYAKSIIEHIDKIETLYKQGSSDKLVFNISVPRASYISYAFVEFVKHYADAGSFEFNFKETNALRAIKNITENNFNLGIVRFQDIHEHYFMTMLKQKGLTSSLLWEFDYRVMMSVDHPLAKCECLDRRNLSEYIEIAHGDPYVPYIPQSEVIKDEFGENAAKRIFVYERGSQFDLLSNVPTTYMWVSSVPCDLLDKHRLVMKTCTGENKRYKDLLIYRKNYKLSELEEGFVGMLKQE